MRRALTASLVAITAALAFDAAPLAQAQDVGSPPGARPGECYGRAQLPGAAQVWRERVRTGDGGRVRRMVPAQVRWVSRRVLVKAAWTEEVRTPAVWRTVYDRVVAPGAERWASTPARYRRVVDRTLVAPSRLVWVRKVAALAYGGGGPGAETLTPTGEILCRVRIPARYALRTRLVLISPPGRRRVAAAPVVRRVARRELVRAAGVEQRPHAAVYRIERHCEEVRPARVEWVRTGPSYRTVTHVRGGDREGWARVLCPDGLAPWAMQRLQASLDAQGYDAGPADGVGKPRTYDALQRFQRDHRLAVGPITAESARALGVVP